MKKTIISIIAIFLVLAAVASVLVIADKLVYGADGETSVSQETYSSFDIESLVIGIDVGFVTVNTNTPSDSFLVSTVSHEKDFYTVTAEDGKLTIKSAELSWYDRAVYSSAAKYGITVNIPASFDGEIKIHTKTGTISAENLVSSAISVCTSSGNIIVTSPKAPIIEASTNNGNITIENAESDCVTVETKIGNIVFSDSGSFISALTAVTRSGNIDASLCGKRDDYQLTATQKTGEHNVESGGDGICVDLSTDNGNINVSFAN